MPNEILLRQAARLRTLAAIGRARFRARATAKFIEMPKQEIPGMQPETYSEPEPDDLARTVAAELLHRVALDESGAPFDSSNPDTWQAEDDAEPEVIRLGPVRLRVVDSDPTELALAAGAIEEGSPPNVCMLVEFDLDESAPHPSMGQYVVLPADDDVSLVFYVFLSFDDLHDSAAPDLGEGAVRNFALDVLKPSQALLVQVVEDMEAQ